MKSVGVTANNVISEIAPNLSETTKSTTDSTREIINNIRRSKTNNQRIADALLNNKYMDFAKKAYKNAVTDISTGNLNNQERFINGLMNDDTDIKSFDMGEGFSFGDEENVNVNIYGSDDNANAEALLKVSDQVAKSSIGQVKMQKAAIDTTISLGASIMQQSSEIGNEIINQLNIANTNLSALVEFNNSSMTKFMEASMAYYDSIGAKITSSDNSGSNNGRIRSNDIIGSHGNFNFSNYKDYVKKNISDLANNSEYGMLNSLLDKDTLGQMANNPIGFMSESIVRYMMPKMLTTTIQTMEAQFTNMVPTLLAKLGDMSTTDSTGIIGKITSSLGSVFGIKHDTGISKFDKNNTKLGPIPFDGETKHAINNIITKELSEQTGYLKIIASQYDKNAQATARNNAEVWSHYRGEFTTKEDLSRDIAQQISDAVTESMKKTKFGSMLSSASNDIIRDKSTDKGKRAMAEIDNTVAELLNDIARSNKTVNLSALLEMVEATGASTNTRKAMKEYILKKYNTDRNGFNGIEIARTTGANAYSDIKDKINEDQTVYGVDKSTFRNAESIDKEIDRLLGWGIENRGNRTDIKRKYSKNIKYSNKGYNNYSTGIMNSVSNTISELFTSKSIDVIFKNVGNSVINGTKEIGGRLKNYFFGEKDEDDNTYKNGVFSDIVNNFKEKMNVITDTIKDKMLEIGTGIRVRIFGEKDIDNNTYKNGILSDIINSTKVKLTNFGDIIKNGFMGALFGKTQNPETGKWETDDTKDTVFSKFKSTFERGIEEWNEMIFGTKETFSNIKNNAAKFIEDAKPNIGNGALIGTGIGLFSGSSLLGTIVGGPIAGAGLGAAAGLLSKSEKFQTWLFGEKDENGNRIGGIISKRVQDYFKDSKNEVIGDSIKGMAITSMTGTGLLGTLVGGPVAGAILGIAGGLMAKSGVFNRFLFGDERTGQKGIINGIRDAWNSNFKDNDSNSTEIRNNGLKSISLVGASSGGLLGLLAGGPLVGAVAGLALSIKSQGKSFKEYLFGKEDGLDLGNGKKRDEKGLFGKVANSLEINLINPLKIRSEYMFKTAMNTIEHKILMPFSYVAEGLANTLGATVGKLTHGTGDFFNKITGSVKSALAPVTETVGKIAGKAADMAFNSINRALSVPGTIVESVIEVLDIKNKLSAWWNNSVVGKFFTGLKNGIKNGVKSLIKYTWKLTKGLLTAPFKLLKGGVNLLRKGVDKLSNGRIGNAVNAVKDKISNSKLAEVYRRRMEEKMEGDSLYARMLRNKEEFKNTRKAIKNQRKNQERHQKNAKLIYKATGKQFSSDTDDARNWLKANGREDVLKRLKGDSETTELRNASGESSVDTQTQIVSSTAEIINTEIEQTNVIRSGFDMIRNLLTGNTVSDTSTSISGNNNRRKFNRRRISGASYSNNDNNDTNNNEVVLSELAEDTEGLSELGLLGSLGARLSNSSIGKFISKRKTLRRIKQDEENDERHNREMSEASQRLRDAAIEKGISADEGRELREGSNTSDDNDNKRSSGLKKYLGGKSVIGRIGNFLLSKKGLITVGALFLFKKFPNLFSKIGSMVGTIVETAVPFITDTLVPFATNTLIPFIHDTAIPFCTKALGFLGNIAGFVGGIFDNSNRTDGNTIIEQTGKNINDIQNGDILTDANGDVTHQTSSRTRTAIKAGTEVAPYAYRVADASKIGVTKLGGRLSGTKIGKAVGNTVARGNTAVDTMATNAISKLSSTKVGKTVGKVAAKSSTGIKSVAAKVASSRAVSKIATSSSTVKKAMAYFTKILTTFFDILTKLFSKRSKKSFSTLFKKLLSRILNRLGKAAPGKLGKLFTKASAKIGGRAAAEGLTAGAIDVAFTTFGAIDGAQGTAKLFEVNDDDVDKSMTLISSVMSAVFNSSSIALAVELVLQFASDIMGEDLTKSIAMTMYAAIKGGEDSEDYIALKNAQDEWKDVYNSERDDDLQKQYQTQIEVGIIDPEETSFEDFKNSVLKGDGKYNASYKSFQDWNAKKNATTFDKFISKVGGIKTKYRESKNAIFGGNTSYTDSNGNTYTDNGDGTFTVTDSSGKNLGKVSKKAVNTKGMTKNTSKGLITELPKFIGEKASEFGTKIKSNAKGMIGSITDSVKNFFGGNKNKSKNKGKELWLSSDGSYYTKDKNNTYTHYSAIGDELDTNIDSDVIEKAVTSGLLIKTTDSDISKYKSKSKAYKQLLQNEKDGKRWDNITKDAIESYQKKYNITTEMISKSTKDWDKYEDAINSIFDNQETEYGWFDYNGCVYVYNNGTFKYCNINGDVLRDNVPKNQVESLAKSGCLTRGKLPKRVKEESKSFISTITGAAETIWSAAKDTVTSAWSAAKDTASSAWSATKDTASSAVNWLADAGSSVVDTLVDGASTFYTGLTGNHTAGDVGGFGRGSKLGGRGGYGETYFSQNDPRWANMDYSGYQDKGTMSDSGCGPAAVAMAINQSNQLSGRSGSVTPVDMANLAQSGGYRDASGTNASFIGDAARNMGIKTTERYNPSAASIKNEINSGNSVVLLGKGDETKTPYTSSGHYIVASKTDNDNYAVIKDPRGTQYSGIAKMSDITRGAEGIWSLSGGRGIVSTGINALKDAGNALKNGAKEVGGKMLEYAFGDKFTDKKSKSTKSDNKGVIATGVNALKDAGKALVNGAKEVGGQIKNYITGNKDKSKSTSSSDSSAVGDPGDGSVKAADVIAIAEAELGYYEKASSSELDSKDANKGQSDHTKYGKEMNEVFGHPEAAAWCATFVTWVFYQAAGKDKEKCKEALHGATTASCSSNVSAFKSDNAFKTDNPKPGDVVYYDYSHTGIVIEVKDDEIITIEGNTSGDNGDVRLGVCVAKKHRKKSGSSIKGYGDTKLDTTSGASIGDSTSIAGASSQTTSKMQQLINLFSGVTGEFGTRLMSGDTSTDYNDIINSSLGIGTASPSSDSSSSGDSSSSSSSTGNLDNVSIDTGDVPKTLWKCFKTIGYSDAATAGIMGNVQQESSMNPALKQYGGGPGRGLFQMEEGSDRFNDICEYAAARGKDWTDVASQVKYASDYMDDSRNKVFFQPSKYASGNELTALRGNFTKVNATEISVPDFKKQTDVDMATRQFCAGFERPGKPMIDNRVKYAKKYYEQFKGKGGKSNYLSYYDKPDYILDDYSMYYGGYGDNDTNNISSPVFRSVKQPSSTSSTNMVSLPEINRTKTISIESKTYKGVTSDRFNRTLSVVIDVLEQIAVNTNTSSSSLKKLSEIKQNNVNPTTTVVNNISNKHNDDSLVKTVSKKSNSADKIARAIAQGGY